MWGWRVRSMVWVGIIVGLAAPAVAQTSPAAPESSWYGWQTLAADGAGAALGFALAAYDDDGPQKRFLVYPATGAYALGGLGSFAVHAAHGRGAMVAARLWPAPMGALLGLTISCLGDQSRGCGGRGARYGFAGGAVAAAFLDAGVFAWDEQ
jgi:hypothetical protein